MSSIRLEVWTGHFLGTRAKGEELLTLVENMDEGRWIPDKWGLFEPIRSPYRPESREAILSGLTQVRGNLLFFKKKKPRAGITVESWRERVPRMNYIWLDLDAKAFSIPDGVERLKRIVLDLVAWSGAVYATAWHSKQAHSRVAQGTPEKRLEQMDWLTFFGEPYLALFGGSERVRNAPCYSVEDAPGGLLLLAAPKPDSPEMTDSDQILVNLEEYLGADAFAGRGYPAVPCRVPQFDLSQTVTANAQIEETKEQKLERVKKELIEQGHEYIGKKETGHLVFKTKDGMLVYVSEDSISIDMTGEDITEVLKNKPKPKNI